MGMAELFKANAAAVLGADQVTESGHRSGSTDMGDISHVMPTLHPYMGGATGSGHGADYAIADPKVAYVEPAKQLALMAVDLLWDDAAGARDILEGVEAAHDQGGLPLLPALHLEDRALPIKGPLTSSPSPLRGEGRVRGEPKGKGRTTHRCTENPRSTSPAASSA